MTDDRKNTVLLLITVVILSIVMILVDGVVKPPYFYKSLLKIILFLFLPLSYFLIHKGQFKELKRLFLPKKKGFCLALILGAGVFAVIFGG